MSTREKTSVGVWLIGGRGSIAATTMLGKSLLQDSKIEPIGMLTYSEQLQHLPLINWQQVKFGGCDIHSHSLKDTLATLLGDGVIPAKFLTDAVDYLEEVEPNIDNILDTLGRDETSNVTDFSSPRLIQAVRYSISEFKRQQKLERVIVIDVSSTQPVSNVEDKLFSFETWCSLNEFLTTFNQPIPWSVIYSTAALLENCAYINFTPNIGTDLPGLQDLARQRKLPHAGKDGKTGETLLKTVLAPMFIARQLKVLTWQGYNMLGNSDGKALADPITKKAKIRSKDSSLRQIFQSYSDLHTHVEIDYVPSLGDWKTAFNFIHFEGFLNVKMSLQFTWSGCDTILAVPLVLDLIRLVELAWQNGEYGKLDYLSAYFKSPIGSSEQAFSQQMTKLLDALLN